jgi:hypothetical protein
MAIHQNTVKPRGRHIARNRHRFRLAMALSTVVLLIGIAVPAWAANTVGTRLNLFGGDVPTAGEPFHVMHGFGNLILSDGFEQAPWDFVLFVDGVEAKDSGVLVERREDGGLNYGRVYNFPEGMTGEVTFEGHWYQSCRAADSECDPGAPPGSKYEILVLERTVDFGG